MFGTIRKHQTWLWVIIIGVVVITFVFYFSPYQNTRDAFQGPALNLGSVDGKPVTEQEYRQTGAEIYLRYLLNRGEWPDTDPAAKQSGFDEQREIYQRLLLLRKLQEMDIQIGNEQVAQLAADILRNFGRGRVVPLETFEKQVLQSQGHRFTAEDFQRFLRHELGIQQLIHVAGMPGTLITPQAALDIYRHEHEELVAELVVFPLTNYLSAAEAPVEELSLFYTNQMARYRIPERIQISYVKFDLTNYWDAADAELARQTNLNQIVDSIYEQRGTNYYHDVTPEQARIQIHDELRKNAAFVAARKQAIELAGNLFDQTPLRAELLETWATEKGLTLNTTAPFDREHGPTDLDVAPAFANAAFALREDEALAGPLQGNDGVYLIALAGRLPSEIPPLESIREQVVSDYGMVQAVNLAHQTGATFHETLTNGLAEGKKFSAICLEAGLNPIALPHFSRSTRSLPELDTLISLPLLADVAFRVPDGQASAFVPTGFGGFIVYVQSRLPADEQKLQSEMPAFLALLRQTGQSEAFNNWFMREANLGLRDTPLARPAQPQVSGTTPQ